MRPNSGLKRVLLVVDSLQLGGAERHVTELAVALSQRGDEVALACSQGGPLAESLREAGIPIHVLAGRLVKRRSSAAYAMGLRRLLQSGRFDLVHAHLYASATAAALAVTGLPVPLILTQHSEAIWQGGVARTISRRVCARATRVIAVSRSIARFLADCYGVTPERIEVIPNAVNTAWWCDSGRGMYAQSESRTSRAWVSLSSAYPVAADPLRGRGLRTGHRCLKVDVRAMGSHRAYARGRYGALCLGDGHAGHYLVGAVARLETAKGVATFLEAAAAVREAEPGCRFMVVGDGPLRGRLEHLAARLGLGGSVQFLGFQTRAPLLIAGLDVLAVPSLSEGAPLVTLEAMASGVPVVASAAGGIPEQIRHERDGLLVAPGDARGLAAACVRLLRDENLRRRLGEDARERSATMFRHSRLVDRTLDLYTAAINDGAAARRCRYPKVEIRSEAGRK